MGPMGLQDDEWCDEGKVKDQGKDQGKDRACPHSAACILLATL